jgi:hypothetical protein
MSAQIIPFAGNPRALFSTDSAKAIKAAGYAWLNGILYLAPHTAGTVGTTLKFNLCSHADSTCIAPCLGTESGQAGIKLKSGKLNNTERSRANKAQAFMTDRTAFMRLLARQIALLIRKAARDDVELCVRLNGCSDIAWEGAAVDIDADTCKALNRAGHACDVKRYRNLFELFPAVPFIDYTKNDKRVRRMLRGELPSNYWLTFSRSGKNEATALELLSAGANVAVVFGGGLPTTWNGFPVLDGDKHDLRNLDPRGGYVVGLSPKGNKAKRDRTSGFVLWSDPAQAAPAIASAPVALAA